MGLGTFERYRAAPMVSREERLLWALWSAKWLTCARLVDLRVTVLALDSDAFVLTNPFALLNAPPLSHYAMVVPAEGARVNIGFLYVRGASVSPGGRASMSTRTRTPSPPPTPYGLAWGGPPLRHISLR